LSRNDLYPQEQLIKVIDQIITNVSSLGVFVLDRKTAKVITGNDVFAQIHGYLSSKDLRDKVYWDLLLPMDIQSPLVAFQQSGYFQGEVRGFLRGNNIILLDFTILDIHRFDIILGLIRDITEQRDFSKQLKESEARYRAFVENIREGLLILDKQENIAFVNPVLCRSLGYTRTELINKNFSEITYPEGFKSIKAQIRDGNEEFARQIEVKMISKIGRDRIFFVSAAPLYDSQSGYTGTIITCVDVTDRYLGIQKEADNRGALLRMVISENSEQLLLTQGWLDIIKTSLPEQHERIEKLVKIVDKVIRFNRQITASKHFNAIIESPLTQVSVPEFIAEINELITPIVSLKDCQIKFNPQKKQLNLYECPMILAIAIEQIIQNSLARSSLEIVIDIKLASENQLQIVITDDGRTFLKTPEPPEASKLLMDIYLSDVLLREIGGKLTVTDILPKEGLQFSLFFPSKTRET
jgi:PAS domain S-box-containing protein